MSAKKPRVLDVGQCDFDHGNIQLLLSEAFGAEVERAQSIDGALEVVRARAFDLVLVNRVLDTDGALGLDLIRRLKSEEATRAMPVALVSNHADAQDAAVALGARRGFGKGALTRPETRELLASILIP